MPLTSLGSIGVPANWGYRRLALPGVTSALRVLAQALKLPNPAAVRLRIVRSIMQPIFAPMPLADAWIAEQLAIIDKRPEILVSMALVTRGDPSAELARSAALIRAPRFSFTATPTAWCPARRCAPSTSSCSVRRRRCSRPCSPNRTAGTGSRPRPWDKDIRGRAIVSHSTALPFSSPPIPGKPTRMTHQ